MNSISFFDNNYPIRTFYSDSNDFESIADSNRVEQRNHAIQTYLHTPLKDVMFAQTTHSSNVLTVTSQSNLILDKSGVDTNGYDAIITSKSQLLICVATADCPPLFLYDPQKHVAAIAHCGWRGICKGIVTNTVSVMEKRFGIIPKNLIVALGPSICEKCYEVGEELIDRFSDVYSINDIDLLFYPNSKGKYYLNLKKAITIELCNMGVPETAIHDTKICTYESKNYYSFRRARKIEPSKLTISGIVLI